MLNSLDKLVLVCNLLLLLTEKLYLAIKRFVPELTVLTNKCRHFITNCRSANATERFNTAKIMSTGYLFRKHLFK